MITTEERLVWLESPEQFTYLREGIALTTKPRGPISRKFVGKGGKLIGYAEHTPNGSGTYTRRIWWLVSHDRDLDPTGVYREGRSAPAEAVYPESIRLGDESRAYSP